MGRLQRDGGTLVSTAGLKPGQLRSRIKDLRVVNTKLSVSLAGSLLCLALSVNLPVFAGKLEDAVKLYNNRQYREALPLLEAQVKANPADAYAAYYAALAYQQLGNMNSARYYYKIVATVSPTSQIGGYAKTILSKIDPSFVGSASSSASRESTSLGSTRAATVSSTTAIDPRLPKECDVRCRKERGSVVVTPTLNGRPIDMVFDTGAPGIVLGKDQLESLGIKAPSGQPAGVTGGSSNTNEIKYWEMMATVKLGPIEKEMPIEILETNDSQPLFGQTFFKEFDYTIDQGGGSIHFRQKGLGSAGKDRNAYSVPFEFRKAGNRIIVTVEINGRPGKAMFDTGNSANAICFTSDKQARKFGVTIPEDARISYHSGVSGRGQVRIFTVGHVRMGPIDESNVECSVNQDGDDDDLPLLGEPFWKNYQYTIDMNTKQIHFVRR